MTLEHSFPGLRSSPGGAIVAVADNLFDLTGPANAMTAEVLQNHARQIIEEIKAIDPGWHYDEIVPIDALGNPIQTVDGLSAKVNDLRFQRAVAVARLKGDYEPLQIETPATCSSAPTSPRIGEWHYSRRGASRRGCLIRRH